MMGVVGVSLSADDDDGESLSHLLHTLRLSSRRMIAVTKILLVFAILSASNFVSSLVTPSRGRLTTTTTMQFRGGGMMKKGSNDINNNNPGSGFTKSSFVGSGTSKGLAGFGSSSGMGGGLGAAGAKTSFGGFGGGLGATSKGVLGTTSSGFGSGNALKGGLGGNKSSGGFSLSGGGGGGSGGGMLKGNVSGSTFGPKASSSAPKSTSGGFSFGKLWGSGTGVASDASKGKTGSSSFGFGGGLGATSKGGLGAAPTGFGSGGGLKGVLGVGLGSKKSSGGFSLGGGAGGGGMLKGKTAGSSFGSNAGFSFGGGAGSGIGGASKGTLGTALSSFGSSSSGLLGSGGMLSGKSAVLKPSTSIGFGSKSSGGFTSGGMVKGQSSFGSKSAFGSNSLEASENSGGGFFSGIMSSLGFGGDKESSSKSGSSLAGPFFGRSSSLTGLGDGIGGGNSSFGNNAGKSSLGGGNSSFGSGNNMFGGGGMLKGQQSSFGESTKGLGRGLGSPGQGGDGTTIGVNKSSFGGASFGAASKSSFGGNRNNVMRTQSFGGGLDASSTGFREESSDTELSGNPISNFFGSIFGDVKEGNDGKIEASSPFDSVSQQHTVDRPAQVPGSDFFSGLKRGILMDTEPNVLLRTDANQGQLSMPSLNTALGSGRSRPQIMSGPSQALGKRSHISQDYEGFRSNQFAQTSTTGTNADFMRNPGFDPQGNTGRSAGGGGPGNPTGWNADQSRGKDTQRQNRVNPYLVKSEVSFGLPNQSTAPLSTNVMMAKNGAPPRPLITTEARTSITTGKSYLNELLPTGSTNPQLKQSVGLGSNASRYSSTNRAQKRVNHAPTSSTQQQSSFLSEILPDNFRSSASAVRYGSPTVLGSDASLAPLLRRKGANADHQPFGNMRQSAFLSESLPETQRIPSVKQQPSFLSEILPDNFRPSAWAARYNTPTLLGSDASLAPLAQRQDSANVDPQPFGTLFRSSILSDMLPETQRLSATATRYGEQPVLGSDASLSPLSPKSSGHLSENIFDMIGTKTSPMLDWFSPSKSSPAISFSNGVYSNGNSLSELARSQASPSTQSNDGFISFNAGLSGSNARGGVNTRSFVRNSGVGAKTATALAMESSGMGETGWYVSKFDITDIL